MSSYAYVSKEEIKKARQANLAQYLMSKGIQLIKSGRRYKSKAHDSLVFTDNAYFWNSRQEHGNALDYVTKHLGMDFTLAVKELSGFNNTFHVKPDREFKINNIELNPNIQRSIAYLNKFRCIEYKIIMDLVKSKLLFQSKQGSNIVFPVRDEKGNIVGAELNGTLSDSRFKGIAENSAYGYGFNIRNSEIKDIKNYMFFESAIDLLSYLNIQYTDGKLMDFKDTLFVSMGGLKINVVKTMIEAFKSQNEPSLYLCVDTDKAAKTFCVKVSQELKSVKIESVISSIFPRNPLSFPVIPSSGKDWNDQLQNSKKKSIRQKLNTIKGQEKDLISKSKDIKNNDFRPCI